MNVPASAPSTQVEQPTWQLRLYVAGMTPAARRALTNLEALCDAYMPGNCDVRVIDVLDEPERAEADQIIAVPTLVRADPLPRRKIIGDLSNIERVLFGLGLAAGGDSRP
jgi:circadian clock protein KaiB